MILRLLALCGRHGTSFLAGGFFVGLLLPALAAALHPALQALIFLLTVATFLGIDWRALAAHARRPVLLALLLGWTMLVAPVIIALLARAIRLPLPLAQALVLWAASPPLISVPAIALLLGLDGALALLVMISGSFLMPLILPPLVLGLIDLKLGVGIFMLMRNLALFIGGAALIAALLRWRLGPERLRRHALALSGVNVVILLLFAIAIMAGVRDLLASRPSEVLLYTATATLASLLLQALTFLVFARLERIPALTAGLIGGSNNMAVVWAALGTAATPEITLFFAAVQVSVFVLPAMLRPVYRRLGAASTPL